MATYKAIDAKGRTVEVVVHGDVGLNGVWIGQDFYPNAKAAVVLPVTPVSDEPEDVDDAREINELLA